MGGSIYVLPEKDQAVNIIHELDAYARSHYWLKILTIESAHREATMRWMKEFLGDRLQIVFLSVTEVNRVKRSLVPVDELITNDETKRQRGADAIERFSDLVLDKQWVRAGGFRWASSLHGNIGQVEGRRQIFQAGAHAG